LVGGRVFKIEVKRKRALFIGIIVLVLLAVLFRYAGVGIVAIDSPEKADLIIVLMGSGPDRILGVVDLYEQGCTVYCDGGELAAGL